MRNLYLYIFLQILGAYSCPSFGIPLSCPSWFSASDVDPGFLCYYDCMLIPTTKESKICPLYCSDLCDENYVGVAFFTLSGIYPGLTDAERALVSDAPREMLRAFAYSWKAESTCRKLFVKSSRNDESDACRHYIWAAITRCNLGLEFATRVLDAHENNPDEPLSEKSMDLANNRAGILACEKMSQNGSFDSERLVKSFQTDLKANRLIVISPAKGDPG